MSQARQGDVLIVETVKIPSTATKEEKCILALGEVTGHAHEIKTGAILWVDTDNTKYVEVYGDVAEVVHPEHGLITLERGIYRIIHQREYAPDEIKHVKD